SLDRVQCIEVLREAGLDLNAVYTHGWSTFRGTPLQGAIGGGHLDMEKYLISSRVDLGAKDDTGCQAIHYAAVQYTPDFADLLLQQPGVDVNATCDTLVPGGGGTADKTVTPLIMANAFYQSYIADSQVSARLLKGGADPNRLTAGGRTALI